MLDECDVLSVSQCHLSGQTPDATLERSAMTASSDLFDAAIPVDGIRVLLQALTSRQASGRRGMVQFNIMGGTIACVALCRSTVAMQASCYGANYARLAQTTAQYGLPGFAVSRRVLPR